MSNVVSQFYGMVVLMPYIRTGGIQPYFEVMYEGKVSKFEIESGQMCEGSLVQDSQEIVADWLLEHRRELKKTGNVYKIMSLLNQLPLFFNSYPFLQTQDSEV